ncbi:hypothetical protein FIBSPDRAFT_951124 [Athelia psychrophila]|uniref:Uncharacterized protein n=1 Tax=Athelia psychrophila TaxID=1759441 RepID=A0A166MVB9_9AGAM|nr:hypothetical protein FIBSPDRAFT_951124 [Fibularhizoctonia sp. CBS 109695]
MSPPLAAHPRLYALLEIRWYPATSPTYTVFRSLEGCIRNQQRIRGRISGDDEGAGRRGGHGIPVVSAEEGAEEAFKRCMDESPSGQLFSENALS